MALTPGHAVFYSQSVQDERRISTLEKQESSRLIVGHAMPVFRRIAVAAVAFHAADDIVQERGPDGKEDADAPGDEFRPPDLGVG